mmetsp:Transcript_10598/g.20085  ORF Transcript_10598/g.20085 Transcript_10598/m.20085 type:complete len:279 (+) Transcript_10598:38-874(+)
MSEPVEVMPDEETQSTPSQPQQSNSSELSAPSAPSAPSGDQVSRPRGQSLGRRVVSGLFRAKQVVLQSLGEIKLPPEDLQFVELIGSFNLDCIALTELQTRTAAYLASQKEVLSHQTSFAESLAKLGSHSKAGAGQNVTIQEFVPYTMRLQSEQADILNQYKVLLVDPVADLLTNHVPSVRELLRKYELARLELGDSNRALKSKTNDANNARVREAQAELDRVKSQLRDQIDIVHSKKTSLLQISLAEFIQKQHKYYEASAKVTQEKMNSSFAIPQKD